MKNLYIIGGPMGVGKTTVSKILTEKLPESVIFSAIDAGMPKLTYR